MTDAEIEALAVKHEAFGFGVVDAKGYTTHGFDPDGLAAFAKAIIEEATGREHEALRQIDEWAKAYPLDVFPEPDLKRAHEVLEAAGLSLGQISAHAMRHVLTGVQKIAAQAKP